MTTFADRLKASLRERRMTQTQLAHELFLSPGAVQAWCGGRTRPCYEDLAKIGDILMVDVGYLVTGKCPDELYGAFKRRLMREMEGERQ